MVEKFSVQPLSPLQTDSTGDGEAVFAETPKCKLNETCKYMMEWMLKNASKIPGGHEDKIQGFNQKCDEMSKWLEENQDTANDDYDHRIDLLEKEFKPIYNLLPTSE